MRFLVMIRRTRTGYSADVPDLPGCIATGKTVHGTRRLMARAIALHLELMQSSGERVPKPKKRLNFVIDDESEEEFCTWVDVKSLVAVT